MSSELDVNLQSYRFAEIRLKAVGFRLKA